MVDHYDENLLLGYVEGDLSPDDHARFEQQMLSDARLRNLVAQLLQDRQALRQMPQEPAPPQLMEAVNQQLERAMLLDAPVQKASIPFPVRPAKLGRWLAIGSLAAMIIVSVGLVAINFLDTFFPPAKPAAPIAHSIPSSTLAMSTPSEKVQQDQQEKINHHALAMAEEEKNSPKDLAGGGNGRLAGDEPAMPLHLGTSAPATSSREPIKPDVIRGDATGRVPVVASPSVGEGIAGTLGASPTPTMTRASGSGAAAMDGVMVRPVQPTPMNVSKSEDASQPARPVLFGAGVLPGAGAVRIQLIRGDVRQAQRQLQQWADSNQYAYVVPESEPSSQTGNTSQSRQIQEPNELTANYQRQYAWPANKTNQTNGALAEDRLNQKSQLEADHPNLIFLLAPSQVDHFLAHLHQQKNQRVQTLSNDAYASSGSSGLVTEDRSSTLPGAGGQAQTRHREVERRKTDALPPDADATGQKQSERSKLAPASSPTSQPQSLVTIPVYFLAPTTPSDLNPQGSSDGPATRPATGTKP